MPDKTHLISSNGVEPVVLCPLEPGFASLVSPDVATRAHAQSYTNSTWVVATRVIQAVVMCFKNFLI